MNIEASVTDGYQQEPADGRRCAECQMPIVGDMFRLKLDVLGETIISETKVYCLDCIIHED